MDFRPYFAARNELVPDMNILKWLKPTPKVDHSKHQMSDAGIMKSPMPVNYQTTRPLGKEYDPMSDLLKSIAQNSMDGNGERLVLGEGMLPLSETSQHGGKYILVHPEVIRKLEGNGIDSFLIYETGLKSELASQIPQIDFVGGDVNKLIKQARGKPDRQLPAHVRQLLWLKENAADYGYVQKGNSWILQ